MAFPVRAIDTPAVLSGQDNGRLDPAILVSVPGQAGGPVVRLVAPAARAWQALCAAALDEGHTLKAIDLHGSYRPFAAQKKLFLSRHTTTPRPGMAGIAWNGKVWFLRAGEAAAAKPGTSNHGRGLAVDAGQERDGKPGTVESITQGRVLGWLVDNEERFGFSHERQDEPWHIRYFAGDTLPPAVLAFEAHQGDDMSVSDVRVGVFGLMDEAARRNTPTGRQLGDDLGTILSKALDPIRDVLAELAGAERVDELKLVEGILGRLTPEAVAGVVMNAMSGDRARELVALLDDRLGEPNALPDS